MSSNVQRLGETLAARMKRTANAAGQVTIELGTIGGGLTLITDSLRVPIPKGDYMIALGQSGGSYITGTSDGHTHTLPGTLRGLQAGDRVLVAWCGNEPVVIATVVSS